MHMAVHNMHNCRSRRPDTSTGAAHMWSYIYMHTGNIYNTRIYSKNFFLKSFALALVSMRCEELLCLVHISCACCLPISHIEGHLTSCDSGQESSLHITMAPKGKRSDDFITVYCNNCSNFSYGLIFNCA